MAPFDVGISLNRRIGVASSGVRSGVGIVLLRNSRSRAAWEGPVASVVRFPAGCQNGAPRESNATISRPASDNATESPKAVPSPRLRLLKRGARTVHAAADHDGLRAHG